MSDTLIDPPRPTVIDDAPPAPAPGDAAAEANAGPRGERAPGPPSPPWPRRRAWLATALAIVAALATVALCAYLFFFRYEPTARRHIPGDANIVVRIEAMDLALFGPVRQHLAPLLDDASTGKPLRARIEDATGLDLATDLREIVIASTDASSWVALVGGRIPKGRFVAGMAKVARDEGWAGFRRQGELLVGPGGVAIGQADDGTLAFGTDVAIVEAALPASDEWQRLDLPAQGAVTFALTRDAWAGAAGVVGATLPRAGSIFRRVDRASGTLTLGDAPALLMRITPASGEQSAALAADIQALLGGLKLFLVALPDVAGANEALAGAQAATNGALVEIRAQWPYDGLDRAIAGLAQRLRARRAGEASLPAAPAP